jgi:hypothetical protein
MRLFIFLLIFVMSASLSYAAIPSIRISNAHIGNARIAASGGGSADQCTGTGSSATIGDQCVTGVLGGAKHALYAGTYNGYKYMTTPSGCGTAIPSTDTCNGGADTTMQWASGAPASNTLIIASPSTVDGKSQSATIAATTGSIAAKFCEQMTFGGYDDWYLPAGNNVNDCTNYSGEFYNVLYKNSNQYRPNNNAGCNAAIVAGPLTGFVAAYYWSSTEGGPVLAWFQAFDNGGHYTDSKTPNYYVRCVRRY